MDAYAPPSSLKSAKDTTKRLLKDIRTGSPSALQCLRIAYPGKQHDPDNVFIQWCKLNHCQHALALKWGHKNWSSLRESLTISIDKIIANTIQQYFSDNGGLAWDEYEDYHATLIKLITTGINRDADSMIYTSISKKTINFAFCVGRSLIAGSEALHYLMQYLDCPTEEIPSYIADLTATITAQLHKDNYFVHDLRNPATTKWRAYNHPNGPLNLGEVYSQAFIS